MSSREEYFIEETGDELFDLRGILLKLVDYWHYFVIAIAVSLVVAFAKNYITLPTYELDTVIAIKEEKNPFLSSSVSLMFNWGGASDKIQTVISILKSRTHNETVVKNLGLDVSVYRMEHFKEIKLYDEAPFYPEIDRDYNQIISSPLFVKVLNNEEYSIRIPKMISYSLFDFQNDKPKYSSGEFEEQVFIVKFDDWFETPFFRVKLNKNFIDDSFSDKTEYKLQISNYNNVVSGFMQNVKIKQKTKDASILQISLRGQNKSEIVRYLNETTKVFQQYELEEKNRVATNTIGFIDKQLSGVTDTLRDAEQRLQKFRESNKLLDVSSEANRIYTRIAELEALKASINLQLRYYSYLNDYIESNDSYTGITAPTVVGVEDVLLINLVSQITQLSIEKTKATYANTDLNPMMDNYDKQLEVLKNTLIEYIDNLIATTNISKEQLEERLAEINDKIQELPGSEQKWLNIKRFYDLSEQQYNFLLQKRSEAGIVKAANMSDVKLLDVAKDVGQGPVAPNPMMNYVISLVVGFLLPLLLILSVEFFNNKIQSPSDIEGKYSIPLLGMIGHSELDNNLVVANSSKSGIAESFRSLRSSLQFVFRRKGNELGNKTILITSSVGSEGKTFTSINLATVLSLSGKKTLLMGVDLRKPKIYNDFGLSNENGLSNFLIGQVSYDQIIQSTSYDNLDIISSGPIPPNPSELLLEDSLYELLLDLKKEYDYIVIDSPPVGLVSDAYQLMQYSDANIYIVRQNYTDKAILKSIDDKYRSKEIENIVFVLNDFVSLSGYGYSYGYGYFDEEKLSFAQKVKNYFS